MINIFVCVIKMYTQLNSTPPPHRSHVVTALSLSCIMRSRFIVFLSKNSHYWDADTGDNDCFTGKGHTNQVTKMAVNDNDELVTCSMDDTLRFTSLSKKEYR